MYWYLYAMHAIAKDVDWTQAFGGSIKKAMQALASGKVQLPAGGAILRSYSRRRFYRISTATLPASQPSCATLSTSAMSHAEPQAVGFSPPCMCSYIHCIIMLTIRTK